MPSPSYGRSTQASLTADQLRALHAVAAAVHGAREVSEILSAASRAAAPALRHELLVLGILDRRHGILEIHGPRERGSRGAVQRLPADSTGLTSVLSGDQARLLETPGSPVAPDCRSLVAAPLWVDGGRPGLLVVGSPEREWFTEEDLPLVEGVAGHVAEAVSRARLLEREERRTRQLRLVSEVARAAVSTLDAAELLTRVVERIHRRIAGTVTSVWLHDPERKMLRLVAVSGSEAHPPGHEVPADQGALGRAVERRRPVLVRDTRRDPEGAGGPGFSGLSQLAVPVITRGRVRAVLDVEANVPDAFDEEESTAVQAVAGMCAAALENSELYREVRSFNETLQAQLAEATRELEQANLEISRQKTLLEQENRSLKQRLRRDQEELSIVGTSRVLREALAMAERVGASEATCLIQGESGTGKELFAQLVHRVSPRVDQPFVTVNCAAIPETLLESTLFGHERGAFTGAARDQRGLVEAAAGGTLFLDEIGEMSPALQAKLLRFLQSGEYYRVGGTDLRQADVRVVSATNRELQKAVDQGAFRGDLFFRIATLVIEVPPLRMRADDIALLVRRFLDRSERGRVLRPTPELIQALEAYAWPGNVRELENVVARLVVLAEGTEVGPELLPEQVRAEASFPPTTPALALREPSLVLTIDELEKTALVRALNRHRGDKRAAAADLGIALRTLYNKIERYGIEPPKKS